MTERERLIEHIAMLEDICAKAADDPGKWRLTFPKARSIRDRLQAQLATLDATDRRNGDA